MPDQIKVKLEAVIPLNKENRETLGPWSTDPKRDTKTNTGGFSRTQFNLRLYKTELLF